jgi:NAD(P)-dependent dehydrogenase (short-subunit alcohol dehydrogenase family)
VVVAAAAAVLWGVVNIPRTAIAAGLPAEAHTVCDDYRPLFETNVFGMANVTMYFMPMLIASRGRIVNTGCLTGVVPIPNNVAYVTSETAIVGWSEALRCVTNKHCLPSDELNRR